MERRTKLWRRQQGRRVFKTRMIYYAAGRIFTDEDGQHPLHWFELAKTRWARVYRTTGTPCSCEMCRGWRYDRLAYKRETSRILHLSLIHI